MRRGYKNRTGIGVISFVVLIIFGIVTYNRIGLANEKEKAEITIDRLNTQIEEQEDRAVDIANFKKYTKTKQYIEDMAREKLGLVYDDEILFEEDK